jgi:hypothetical protein
MNIDQLVTTLMLMGYRVGEDMDIGGNVVGSLRSIVHIPTGDTYREMGVTTRWYLSVVKSARYKEGGWEAFSTSELETFYNYVKIGPP